MDGVTILTTYAQRLMSGSDLLWLIGIIIVIAGLSAMLLSSGVDDLRVVVAVLCLMVCLGSMLYGFICFIEVSHIEHKVAIDDTVNFNEFIEHYEILHQDGKLFTVKEVEVEDDGQ